MVRRRGDERGLVTLLFTDIVGSSDVASELGDERWHRLQARHHAAVRKQLKRCGGREIDTAGDGFFITFPSPARGVRCAFGIVQEVRELGLDVRAGVHIGEAQLTGEKVGGIAVTTAARVSAAAGPGQVLVTDTIVHLVAGSGFEFTDLGSRELKGVPGSWELFDLVSVEGQSIGSLRSPEDARKARDRSSPRESSRQPPRPALTIGIAGFVLVGLALAAVLFTRDRANPTATPTSGPAPEVLVALKDGSGTEPFTIDLPHVRVAGQFGPILLTGRASSLNAFAWVPAGAGGDLHVPQINRTSGAVIDNGDGYLFKTPGDLCVCVASAQGYMWTPITTAVASPTSGLLIGNAIGVSLRGIGIEGQPEKDMLVDRGASGGVAAFVSGGAYLWVGDSFTNRVYRVDPTSSAVKIFPLRQSADLMTFGDGSLWVLDKLGGRLARVDPRSRHSAPSFPISGDPQGMTVGGGFVWVADASEDEIWQIPEDFGSPATAIPLSDLGQRGGSPSAVAYDGGDIIVGFSDGTVMKIDPADPTSPSVIWTYHGRNDASSIAVGDGIVWVAGNPEGSSCLPVCG